MVDSIQGSNSSIAQVVQEQNNISQEREKQRLQDIERQNQLRESQEEQQRAQQENRNESNRGQNIDVSV